MKSPLSLHLFPLFAAAAFSLCSCEVTLQTPLNEADFKSTTGAGSGTVTGQAFTVTTSDNWRGLLGGKKETNFAESVDISLFPVNAYTTELIQKKYVEGAKLAPGDPRFSRYIRTTQTDEQGNFRFSGVPAGDYYVGCAVGWDHYFESNDDDGTPQRYMIRYSVPIHALVSVRNGQATRVPQWQQGRLKKDSSPAPQY
jgi:hypothetical protein